MTDITRIEIHAGTVQSSTKITATGTQIDLEDLGRFRFFVELVESDGQTIAAWTGPDYSDAILEAYGLAGEYGAPVLDLVLGEVAT